MEGEQEKLIAEARQRLLARVGDTRTGGKGSVRRKKRTVHKNVQQDEARLQNTLKRLGLNNIRGIEEVNIFAEDGTVIQFLNPKVQASIGANTYVVSGQCEKKQLENLLPDILQQLGQENIEHLGRAAQLWNATEATAANLLTEVDELPRVTPVKEDDNDDDDVPTLIDTFDT
eukprot:Filipodium_phascolosomae@DN1529_c0_g1_i1.p1